MLPAGKSRSTPASKELKRFVHRYTSGLAQMEAEWGVSRVALLLGVTLFTCGFAVAPMFLAPLSGKTPISYGNT